MKRKAAYLGAITAFTLSGVAGAQQIGPAGVVRFDGHRVVRVTAGTPAHLQTTLALTDDVWTCSGAGLGTFDVRMDPEQFAAFAGTGIPHQVLIEDLQVQIDAERAEIDRLRANPGDQPGWFDVYRSYAEIRQYVLDLAAAHPGLATSWVAGRTHEGRDIVAIRITGPGDRTDRPVIVLNGCQHAREWVSPMTVTYIADRLLTRYATDPQVRAAVDSVEWVILPLLNADGYEYSWNTNRMWRKNRRPPPAGSSCWGVDTNRNWGHQWGLSTGSSGNPCSDIYRGAFAFSEKETQTVRDLVNATPRTRAYIDFHSYSQLVLEPWGYTPTLPPDHATLQQISAAMVGAIQSVHGLTYVYGPGYSTIYPTSGTAPDWTYGAKNVLSWTIELRDNGTYGFILPPQQIVPTAEENFAAVLALAGQVGPKLMISFPYGAPIHVTPDQPTVLKVSVRAGLEGLQAGSVRLYHRVGSTGAPQWTAMTPIGGDLYQAILPAAPCGSVVQYVVQAVTTQGVTVKVPPASFVAPLTAEAVTSFVTFDDDAEQFRGWAVGGPGSTATEGVWVRQIPQATTAQPGYDRTPGSGVYCFVTDHRAGAGPSAHDVDNGVTILTSPIVSAVGAPNLANQRAYVRYWRWYSNDRGAAPGTDPLVVQISGNGGASWTTLEEVRDTAGVWVQREFRISDFVTPSDQVRLRVLASDLAEDSVVEALLDDIQVRIVGCEACYPDCNGDGLLNLADFGCFQTKFATGNPYADCNGDGVRNLADFGCFQTKFAVGCP